MEKIKIVSEEEIYITITSSFINDPIRIIDELEALEQGEAQLQIAEGGSYEFLIDQGFLLEDISGVVTTSKLNKQAGRITPNVYVGTLQINVLNIEFERVGVLRVEVESRKTNYREDYRRMLEEIAEKCTELLMQHSSPVIQTFTVDYERDSSTAYQRFAFIKSVIDSDEFESAIHKIISFPTTKWRQVMADTPIQALKRVNKNIVRQFSSATKKLALPDDHYSKNLISSLPPKVQTISNVETVDTPENRFIKFALETFSAICSDFGHLPNNPRLKKEALLLEEKLEHYLNGSVFKEVSTLSSVPLNNPVLQRKEGYREIYRNWLLLDLAAKLIWKGGQDVYEGNKRDVAVLYEYWLFFKLIETVTEVFHLMSPKPEDLIEVTFDGFGLKLRQGEYLPLKNISNIGSRKLYVQLSYNRTYKGDQEYPKSGSWSRNLRPDYTLTIWPFGITEDQAEEEELIVHIHFDAKYKVEKFQEIFSDQIQLDEEKDEQRKGTYKRADLLKMHAYRDAIRRTAGAYVLYPGDDQPRTKKGFHEIVPGLGAFAIRPIKSNNGIEELKSFLNEVVSHFMNRASQREKMSLKAYETYKVKKPNELKSALPETYGSNRDLIPDDTFVLVGYYKRENWNWISKSGLYNARAGDDRGSLRLGPQMAGAKYLLLHSDNETITTKLLKIIETGPRVFSKQTLVDRGYSSPKHDYYLVYKVEEVKEKELVNKKWDLKNLEGYKRGRASGLPFVVTLTELMNALVLE